MILRINQLLMIAVIGLCVMQNVLWLAFIISLLFTFYYGAVWLVFLAIGVDTYYGAFSNVPVFSIVALIWFIVSELLKLRLRIMN